MARSSTYFLVTLALLAPCELRSQPPVSRENLYERVIAVVPLVGDGTRADPKRPMFAPLANEMPGILSFSFHPSDDGKSAIVEFVAVSRKALDPILKANRPDVKVFIRGQHRKEEIEAEIRRHKANLDLDDLAGPGRKPVSGGAR
jgi:hypothetical protein